MLSKSTEKICEVCNKLFKVLKWYAKKRKTCSKSCGTRTIIHSKKSNGKCFFQPEKWQELICLICNKSFRARKKRISQNKNIFCSRRCAGIFRSQTWDHNKSSYKTGYYYNEKLQKKMKVDSSWEYQRMFELDKDPNIVFWDRCEDKILYLDNENNKHHYQPDFYILYKDDSIAVEEIKGLYRENDHLKIDAARTFYKEKGIDFRIIDSIYFQNKEVLLPIIEEYENEYGVFHSVRFETTWMNFAKSLTEMSQCLRNKVGAVFLNQNMDKVLGFGFNHNPSKHQCDTLEPGKCRVVSTLKWLLCLNQRDRLKILYCFVLIHHV